MHPQKVSHLRAPSPTPSHRNAKEIAQQGQGFEGRHVCSVQKPIISLKYGVVSVVFNLFVFNFKCTLMCFYLKQQAFI